uniref:Uncharacterized protein n=1 Tax=Solanum lycopersicum TaxID=4081 RepID=A0A3Q7JCU9_SOLLC
MISSSMDTYFLFTFFLISLFPPLDLPLTPLMASHFPRKIMTFFINNIIKY